MNKAGKANRVDGPAEVPDSTNRAEPPGSLKGDPPMPGRTNPVGRMGQTWSREFQHGSQWVQDPEAGTAGHP